MAGEVLAFLTRNIPKTKDKDDDKETEPQRKRKRERSVRHAYPVGYWKRGIPSHTHRCDESEESAVADCMSS